MSDEVKLITTSTFAIITLAWVLVHASDVQKVTSALADGYTKAVTALRP